MRRSLALTVLALSALSQAQLGGWFRQCIDPANTQPYSSDFNVQFLDTPLMRFTFGLSGTVTYGGQSGPCYAPTSRSLSASGRFAMSVGNVGSVQTNDDDNMAMTVGAPLDAVGDYMFARILIDSNDPAQGSALFGDGGIRVFFIGASNRYGQVTWSNADVDVRCTVRVLGDAARFQWDITNLSADPAALGLAFGVYPGMFLSGGATDPATGATQAHSLLGTLSGNPKRTADGYIGYSLLPNQRPLRTEKRYQLGNPRFPSTAKFLFGQTLNTGMRVDNLVPTETPDATGADLFVVANHRTILFDNAMSDRLFGDQGTLPAEEVDYPIGETSFLQRFPTRSVVAGGTRTIVHYVRQSWSVGDYRDPFTFIVDAPKLIATDRTDPLNFTPEPFTVRAWVDNQFARVDKEIPLNNVQFRIFLPEGMSLAPGESAVKTLGRVDPNALGFVDFQVVTSPEVVGNKQIRVTVQAAPGPVRELITDVLVSAQPRLRLPEGASLVTIPYTFNDSSFDNIFGLQTGIDFQVFRFDALSNSYRPAESAERGVGYWVVPTSDLGTYTLQEARQPADAARGGLSLRLQNGWNLIGNPYSYPVSLREVNGVFADNPGTVFTLDDLVRQGILSSTIAAWDRTNSSGQYTFISSTDGVLSPHVGYWVFVNTFNPVTLVFPPVFAEGLPDSGRSTDDTFVQNARNWRLELALRSAKGIDARNYVGLVSDPTLANRLDMPKPPMAPGAVADLRIMGDFNGKPMEMSRSFEAKAGRESWTVRINATEAGEYTLTWPNLGQVPRGVRLKITDSVTGETKDLRATTGLTVNMTEAGTRDFTITAEPGGSSRPVIGDVTVSRPSRDSNAPMTIAYTLSSDAQVTVRVLSATGREVYTVTRGRSDASGQNTATWFLRDNADRAVAPGTYRIEILAETASGERVRRIVPVNVTR